MSICTIGILVAIAIPYYTMFLKRAKITESLSLMSGIRTDMAAHYSYYGEMPRWSKLVRTRVKTGGKYTTNITGDKGILTAGFNDPELKNYTLTMRSAIAAYGEPKVILWLCGYKEAPPHFPVPGENRTTVPPQYLSFTCR
ncbi:MAG: pilin [Gammaproteobacteria bacterium]|nr:pilin [Gammaproteobacteria bacterium]